MKVKEIHRGRRKQKGERKSRYNTEKTNATCIRDDFYFKKTSTTTITFYIVPHATFQEGMSF
jgi:hypothetical protein